jgi:hypothetical protein
VVKVLRQAFVETVMGGWIIIATRLPVKYFYVMCRQHDSGFPCPLSDSNCTEQIIVPRYNY